MKIKFENKSIELKGYMILQIHAALNRTGSLNAQMQGKDFTFKDCLLAMCNDYQERIKEEKRILELSKSTITYPEDHGN